MKYIDLFAGVGGFRTLDKYGECVFSSEIDPHAVKTYEANYETPSGDITSERVKLTIPEFDILCAGFPCQPFSHAGLQKGFEDTRGTLFFDIIDIAQRHSPHTLILENVPRLLTHDKGKTFKVIQRSLKDLGYNVHYSILGTHTHGNIPQNRRRLFIVATTQLFEFPEPIPLTTRLHDFLLTNVPDNYYYHNRWFYPQLEEEIEEGSLYTWRRSYVRKTANNLCPAITAFMGTGGNNVPLWKDSKGIRKLTPRECFNLQGFSPEFTLPPIADSHLYKQAGNTITPILIDRLYNNLTK